MAHRYPIERAHSSPAVLLGELARTFELERWEIRDSAGSLVAVEIRRGYAFQATWGADFDRTLQRHPTVAAAGTAWLRNERGDDERETAA
jgi:hypothetical protein